MEPLTSTRTYELYPGKLYTITIKQNSRNPELWRVLNSAGYLLTFYKADTMEIAWEIWEEHQARKLEIPDRS